MKHTLSKTLSAMVLSCLALSSSFGQTDITNLGNTTTAQYSDSPSGEDIAKVIDNSSRTKYLTFNQCGYIQVQVSDTHRAASYTITSADDAPGRDPQGWTLYGSNNGSNWTVLDTRSNEDFPRRFQKRSFSVSNSAAYSYFRLDMCNNNGRILQLAEWEVFGNSNGGRDCEPSLIESYVNVNGRGWSQSSSVTADQGADIQFGPQPIGGSWSWSGPNHAVIAHQYVKR